MFCVGPPESFVSPPRVVTLPSRKQVSGETRPPFQRIEANNG